MKINKKIGLAIVASLFLVNSIVFAFGPFEGQKCKSYDGIVLRAG